MRKILVIAAVLFILAAFLAPLSTQACDTCEIVFNSYFCFPGYPGRENCTTTITYCAESGAFCDVIVVNG